MPKYSFRGFPTTTVDFLRELAANNRREWFAEHKPRYERDVLGPALEYVAAMKEPLAGVSECVSVEAKRVGGSLMRIYRDTRFAKDKTPYKTNIGIQFRHIARRDVHAPGLYVHIEPDEVFLGVGMWRPASDALRLIRQRIVEEPNEWKRTGDNRTFRRHFELAGETLKRPPRDFDADHPLIEDIKRKDFIGVAKLAPEVIHEPDFVKRTTATFRAGRPLMQFLCQAIDLPF